MTPDDIINALGMQPHPEGGFYAETFRDENRQDREMRASSTAIYYLLLKGQVSHWHRVDAAEVWHYYAGAPLSLSIAENNNDPSDHVLGANLLAGERPQIAVNKGEWQSACSLGEWTFVGCTVAPGFEFSGFEMAPEGWAPSKQTLP